MQIGPGGIGGSIIAACLALNDNPAGTTDDGLVLADQNSSTGLSVAEVLFQVPARDAAPDMAVFAAAPTSCASFTGDLSGLTFNFTTAPLTSHRWATRPSP